MNIRISKRRFPSVLLCALTLVFLQTKAPLAKENRGPVPKVLYAWSQYAIVSDIKETKQDKVHESDRKEKDQKEGVLPQAVLIARVVVEQSGRDEPHCPKIEFMPLAKLVPMDFYHYADKNNPDWFVCQAKISQEALKARVGGHELLIPERTRKTKKRTIAVVGDTGCRLKGKSGEFQACNDPWQWPWETIAQHIARIKPDLVIHVGDYHYRETACPAGIPGCLKKNGTSTTWANTWFAWEEDFFKPVRALLGKAPWVFLRGNHEDCSRAGDGWFRLISGSNTDNGEEKTKSGELTQINGRLMEQVACIGHTDPYLVQFNGMNLYVMDSSSIEESDDFSYKDVLNNRDDFDRFHDYAAKDGAPAWFLTHQPIWNVIPNDDKAGDYFINNQALQAASGNRLPATVRLTMYGHNHLLRYINFEKAANRPPVLIVGNSGTRKDPINYCLDLTKIRIGGAAVESAYTSPDFSFVTFTQEHQDDHWGMQVYRQTPRGTFESEVPQQSKCMVKNNSIHCHPALSVEMPVICPQ
jgi:hypothetical protein